MERLELKSPLTRSLVVPKLVTCKDERPQPGPLGKRRPFPEQVVQGREEEALGESLQDPAHHDVPGPELSHVGDDEGENGAHDHGYDQEPFGAVPLGYGAGSYLRDHVAPEERGENYALVGPVVSLKKSFLHRCI